ncbi:hypothetical protein GCM10027517_37120 [Phycicoccus ginsengisoli]
MDTRTAARSAARTAAAALVVAGTVGLGTAGSASAEPTTWLPDALLFCGDVRVAPDQWVALPPSDTLWITQGPLTGHYVILGDTHYRAPGYLTAPPPSYAGLEVLGTRTRGAKQGLTGATRTCDFVSRWGQPDAPGTFSVVGPITIARVPG